MFVIFGWVIITATSFLLIFGRSLNIVYLRPRSKIHSLIYHTLNRPFWSLCICWLVWACHHGYGGIINHFLSIRLFIPISKLSFGFYMIHASILHFYLEVSRYRKYHSNLETVSMTHN